MCKYTNFVHLHTFAYLQTIKMYGVKEDSENSSSRRKSRRVGPPRRVLIKKAKNP